MLELLAAIGEDPARPELEGTPRRVADAYAEFFSGVGVDAVDALGETFPFEGSAVGAPAGADVAAIEGGEGGAGTPAHAEPVLMRGIRFRSVCEHHLLPFAGTAHIAYVPGDRLVGLGRLPAVVDVLASRPQLQERLGEQIAQTISDGLDARGVLVVLEATHGCVTLRGPRQTDSTTVTVASRGTLSEPAARAELMALIGRPAAASPEPDASHGVAL
ncbi:MAG: cyclohydrolase FolE [Subtercola sp.]|nr:cyclohydrolase FolE [Subtercola sp.]